MEWLVITALAVGAYLLGSVPTAYLVVRLVKGVDIRKAGSGNVGALNTYHVLGFGPAMVVLLADTAKGVLAVGIPWLVGADYWVIFATTPSVVIGHNWPVFLGFRGGRGAAAILGISLITVPLLTVVSLVPSLLLMWLLRNVVVGAALGFVMVNVLIATTGQPADQAALCYFLTFLVSVAYFIAHRRHICEIHQASTVAEAFFRAFRVANRTCRQAAAQPGRFPTRPFPRQVVSSIAPPRLPCLSPALLGYYVGL